MKAVASIDPSNPEAGMERNGHIDQFGVAAFNAITNGAALGDRVIEARSV